jgi:hypothetical protein
MGVYSDRKIYGVSLKLENISFEKIYSDEISESEKQDVKAFYDSLNADQREKLNVRFFLKFTSTESKFTSWVPSNNVSLEKILI